MNGYVDFYNRVYPDCLLEYSEGGTMRLNAYLSAVAFSSIACLLPLQVSGADTEAAGDCACGPDYCRGDPRYEPTLKKKKDSLKGEGYPRELIGLLDRDGACVARVNQAPDGFSLLLVTSTSKTIQIWTESDEATARADLASGALKGYYKFNVDRAFQCCGDARYDKRPDWDANLGLNTKLAIQCKKSGGSISCQ